MGVSDYCERPEVSFIILAVLLSLELEISHVEECQLSLLTLNSVLRSQLIIIAVEQHNTTQKQKVNEKH